MSMSPPGTRAGHAGSAMSTRCGPTLPVACHLTRDTEAAIAAAGFVIERSERFIFQPCWPSRLSAEHVLGAPADLDSAGHGDARLASQLTECEARGCGRGHEGDVGLGLSIWRLDQEVEAGCIDGDDLRRRGLGMTAEGSGHGEDVIGMMLVQSLHGVVRGAGHHTISARPARRRP